MNHINIDLETFSSQSLKTGGVYRYTESPDFEILLFAYRLNGEKTVLVDLTREEFPDEIFLLLNDPQWIKRAWNASFEIHCIQRHFRLSLDLSQWQCTMIKAAVLSLPMSLDQAGSALNLEIKKDPAGSALIKYFCSPCKPSKSNGMRTRNRPDNDPEKWTAFGRYCVRDVDTEVAIGEKIKWFEILGAEQKLWELDQQINDRGILTDEKLIRKAIQIDEDFRERKIREATQITGVVNPNSRAQLLGWLQQEMPLEEVETLRKEDIPGLIEAAEGYENKDEIARVLKIRQELSKTSIKKYQAMLNVRGADGRARGLFQFYGANRTGRFSGRLVQMQNLIKNNMTELDLARRTVLVGNTDLVDLMGFEDDDGEVLSVPGVLSQLIRTAFIPKKGCRLVVVDSSAIEARTSAWLSGEQWRLDVFRGAGRIYEESAARMFGIPVASVSKDDRARGKVAELALQYQGGPNALVRMDQKKKIRGLAIDKWQAEEVQGPFRERWNKKRDDDKEPRLSEEELLEEFIFSEYQGIVNVWRPANPEIVDIWRELNQAAIEVVRGEGPREVSFVRLYMRRGALFIDLPSGRSLVYLKPVIRKKIVTPLRGEPFEVEGVAYKGVNQEKKTWGYEHTYGGKIYENLNQSIARDCLCYWMTGVAAQGLEICAHVHDEIVLEVPEKQAEGVLKEVVNIMSREIPWAPGLPLSAAGFTGEYYRKE